MQPTYSILLATLLTTVTTVNCVLEEDAQRRTTSTGKGDSKPDSESEASAYKIDSIEPCYKSKNREKVSQGQKWHWTLVSKLESSALVGSIGILGTLNHASWSLRRPLAFLDDHPKIKSIKIEIDSESEHQQFLLVIHEASFPNNAWKPVVLEKADGPALFSGQVTLVVENEKKVLVKKNSQVIGRITKDPTDISPLFGFMSVPTLPETRVSVSTTATVSTDKPDEPIGPNSEYYPDAEVWVHWAAHLAVHSENCEDIGAL